MGGSQGEDRGHRAAWVFEDWVLTLVLSQDSGYGCGRGPNHLNSALVSGKEQFKETEVKLGEIMEGTGKPKAQEEISSKSNLQWSKSKVFLIGVVTTCCGDAHGS